MERTDAGAPFDTGGQWKPARKIAASFGHFSRLFSSAVRELRSGPDRRGGASGSLPGPGPARLMLGRLLASPTVAAKLYFAGKSYRDDRTSALREGCDPWALASLFDTEELAALLVLSLLRHKAKALCHPDEWGRLADRAEVFCDAGAYFGAGVPAVGRGDGMLVGTTRYLVFAALQKAAPEGFSAYMKHLRSRKLAYDLAAERRTWGCDHVQVGALLLTAAGCGAAYAKSYHAGLTTDVGSLHDDRARLLRIASEWLDSLVLRGEPPRSEAVDDLHVDEADLEQLVGRLSLLRKSGSRHEWLSRTGADLRGTPLAQAAAGATRVDGRTVYPGDEVLDQAEDDLPRPHPAG